MHTSKFKCIHVTNCDGVGVLALGKVYDIHIEGAMMTFKGSDGITHKWAKYYMKQFEAVQPKVKGYIFRKHIGQYYLGWSKGVTAHKENAYVYSMAAIKFITREHLRWGGKKEGKWRVVYE